MDISNGNHLVDQLQARVDHLEQQLAIYQSIVAQLSIGLHVYRLEDRDDDATLRMIDANPAVETLTGVAPASVIGRTLDENFPDLRAQGVPQLYANVIRSGEPTAFEVVYGDERVIESAFAVRAMPLPTNCLAVSFENITQHKRDERELERLNTELQKQVSQQVEEMHTFRTLVESAPYSITISNLEGKLSYANPAHRRAHGYDGAVEDITLPQLMPNDAELQAALGTLIAEGRWGGIITHQRADGSTFPMQCDAFFVYDAAGAPSATVVIERDVTEDQRQEAERKALQEQIINAQQAAIRELSTPLLPITDHVVILPLVGALDSSRAQQVMETLLEGIARQGATTAVIDITGIRIVDTQVAQALIQTAQAVSLIGAQAILTGIQPQIAQTLVSLGVDMGTIITHGTLQAGIEQALYKQAPATSRPGGKRSL